MKISEPNTKPNSYCLYNSLNFKCQIISITIIILLIPLGIIIYKVKNNKEEITHTLNNNNNTNHFNIRKKQLYEFNNNKLFSEKRKDINIDYEILYTKNKVSNRTKISIITLINNNDEINDGKIEKLMNSIKTQTLKDIELNIMSDINETKYNDLIIKNSENNDITITIFNYKKYVGKLKKRIDGIYNSIGKYILFIDADDYFTSVDVLEKIYDKALKDDIDILEFTSLNDLNCAESKPVYPPELFDLMYFDKDNFLNMRQFHLVGKIISNKLLLFTLNTINLTYIEEDINHFDEDMILLMIFQRATSFELLKIGGTNKIYTKNDFISSIKEEGILKDLLLFMKFLIQYTDDNVPEKRMAANILIRYLIERTNSISINNIKLFNDIINLYLNCDKIGEGDIKRIKEYQAMVNRN